MIGTVVYISNHKSYVDKAINSCISLKKTNPNVKTLLITKHGTIILNNVFDEVRIQQTDRFGFFNTNGMTFNGSLKYNF